MSDLSLNEQKHVRVALQYLRRRLGTWESVAKALRSKPDTLQRYASGRRQVPAGVGFRVARFAGISVEDLLEGKFAPAGTCPHCGRAPDFIDEETIAELNPRRS